MRPSPIRMVSSTISPFFDENAIPYCHFIRSDSSNPPSASIATSSFPDESEKHAYLLPPRTPSHTSLVALFGFPSRTSPIVKPLPMPSSTRSASRKFDFPLALVPTNRFTRPNVRSTLRRLLKFSMAMRSIIFNSQPATDGTRGPASRNQKPVGEQTLVALPKISWQAIYSRRQASICSSSCTSNSAIPSPRLSVSCFPTILPISEAERPTSEANASRLSLAGCRHRIAPSSIRAISRISFSMSKGASPSSAA